MKIVIIATNWSELWRNIFTLGEPALRKDKRQMIVKDSWCNEASKDELKPGIFPVAHPCTFMCLEMRSEI